MRNKILCLIFLCLAVLSALSSQTSYKKTLEEGLTLIAEMTDKEGLVLKLKNLNDSTIDTVVLFPAYSKPEAITDVWFDSSICGFILETNSMILYYLYSNDGSGWRIVGQQIIVLKDEPRKFGFGGVKLLDPYTLVVTNNLVDGSTKAIYLYDSIGNRTTFTQAKFEETKYKKKE